jgi:hypothetical protein
MVTMFRLNKYLVAVFLLLTFAQGISMRLWMHHWFHESQSAKSTELPSASTIQIKCDCLQDASMPLQEGYQFEIHHPWKEHNKEYYTYNIAVSAADKIFHSLRGPPRLVQFTA